MSYLGGLSREYDAMIVNVVACITQARVQDSRLNRYNQSLSFNNPLINFVGVSWNNF